MPASTGAPAPDFQNPTQLPRSPATSKSADFETERPDWALFGSIDTLGQKAGVAASRLRRLALKELVDNALDAGADVSIEERNGIYIVIDNGPGIAGDPQTVANLFSINRPLRSSKQWRRPQRGALGNGLRVVAGSLIASGGGELHVLTRGQRLAITPLEDGGASFIANACPDVERGTQIVIKFGPYLPKDDEATTWANQAIAMSRAGGPEYSGKSSPHWYHAQSFYDLIHWSGERPVRDLIANLDGCSGEAAGQITAELRGRTAASLTRSEATALLGRARMKARPPSIKRLGAVGDVLNGHYYASKSGLVELGTQEPKAQIPFIVEAWAEKIGDSRGGCVTAYVNRTPITGDVHIIPDKKVSTLYGCGVHADLDIPIKGRWSVVLNLTAPFVPITTDGKEPDFGVFEDEIVDAVSLAIRRAHKAAPKGNGITAKEAVWANLHDVVVSATDGGRLTASQRQIMYKMRPIVQSITGKELQAKHFNNLLTEYEAEHGEFGALYRDNRGALYVPGADYDVPVGTIMARKYNRDPWTFGAVLYIEKQALFESLKAEKWPERYDCALLTGKGFATRAVKDILDNLIEHHEPIRIFCIHDGDSAGTLIYETLQNATPARAAREIEIINLGLEPWEAREMGLDPEVFDEKDKRRPVAAYVKERRDGAYWEDWLQSNRYELDAMDTPQFLEWLTAKFDEHRVRKVIPSASVIIDTAQEKMALAIRENVTARILQEADLDAQVKAAIDATELPDLTPEGAAEWLDKNQTENWRGYVDAEIEEIVGDE